MDTTAFLILFSTGFAIALIGYWTGRHDLLVLESQKAKRIKGVWDEGYSAGWDEAHEWGGMRAGGILDSRN